MFHLALFKLHEAEIINYINPVISVLFNLAIAELYAPSRAQQRLENFSSLPRFGGQADITKPERTCLRTQHARPARQLPDQHDPARLVFSHFTVFDQQIIHFE